MIDRTKELLPQMQERFPHIYDVYNDKTILYALLSVYADKSREKLRIIDRLYAMIGIDSTYDEDLEHRWGSLLGIRRQNGESYTDYRNRLLITYYSLSGGTAEAIKYAIASVIGITSDMDAIDEYIKVYDAWEYPHNGSLDVTDTSYGRIVCTVDLQANEDITIVNDRILNAIHTTKASGIYAYLLFLYNINESASILRNGDELVSNNIKYQSQEVAKFYNYNGYDGSTIGTIILGSTLIGIVSDLDSSIDAFADNIAEVSHESTSIRLAILNDNLDTNMYIESDEHADTLICNPILCNATLKSYDKCTDTIIHHMVLGRSTLGGAVLGVNIFRGGQ